MVPNLATSEKDAVAREYGLKMTPSNPPIEIDHIVPVELGGSNDISNLFPQLGAANYRLKNRLESRVRGFVCAGQMTLAAARRGISADWTKLYKSVFHVSP
jgi:hypothetical protein